jgi:two-component system sensor histidine kinase AlgZ
MSLPPPPPPGSKRAYWICQFAGWYGYWLANTLLLVVVGSPALVSITIVPPEVSAQLPAWPRASAEFFLLCGAGILLTQRLRDYMRRRRWDALRPLALTWRVIVAGFILSPLLGIPQHFMSIAALQQMPDATPEWMAFLQHAINWAPLFWIWMAIYFFTLSARKRRYSELRQSELARALQAAELRLLKSQLNPHFLFNSLNSVRALIADDPAGAQHAVTQLARTLRYTLGSSDQAELVTLEQELQMVDDYLGLEGLRLGERLRVERDIAPGATRARVPVMLVQSLVENAIKHGIAELPDGGTLRIAARVDGSTLHLQVDNPRPAKPPPSDGQGVGLRNGAERLRLLFGGAAKLDLDLSRPERAVARVEVPA